ncbi:MAG: hypothetical protein E6R13_08895 [Spirochaetes bacterium]|nr:MAG: hypothetical protein E6R13_08895 [Spirochaetota bacterium]
MKKMIKFPSIEQFRTVVANVNRRYNFVGLDENGDAIYDPSLPKPVLTFKGTVKLHGTNAGVSFNESGYWAQSRENIITPEKDNAGFAFFVESKKEVFNKLFREIQENTNVSYEHNTVTIYGEWCGGNIQKGVAITNLPKSFFIFGVKVTPHTTSEEELKQKPAYWIPSHYLKSPEDNIYNIEDFQTWTLDIDFNMPQLVQNKLSELTIAVEEECPVGKAFGFSGIGEGIVWSCEYQGVVHRFKVKGEKHSSSKVKTLANVDVEKIESIQKFVDYAVTESRFNQAIENVFPNEEPIDTKKLGDVIRWVVNDVIKEEMDTMVENKIEPKEVNKYLSSKVREMFFKLV